MALKSHAFSLGDCGFRVRDFCLLSQGTSLARPVNSRVGSNYSDELPTLRERPKLETQNNTVIDFETSSRTENLFAPDHPLTLRRVTAVSLFLKPAFFWAAFPERVQIGVPLIGAHFWGNSKW